MNLINIISLCPLSYNQCQQHWTLGGDSNLVPWQQRTLICRWSAFTTRLSLGCSDALLKLEMPLTRPKICSTPFSKVGNCKKSIGRNHFCEKKYWRSVMSWICMQSNGHCGRAFKTSYCFPDLLSMTNHWTVKTNHPFEFITIIHVFLPYSPCLINLDKLNLFSKTIFVWLLTVQLVREC